MSSKNVILMNTAGDQIYPATTAEQVAYNSSLNMKQALDTVNSHATVANTAAQMVDTTKIYVYTGSETGYEFGHWYYYDSTNEEWTDGGEYFSAAQMITIVGTGLYLGAIPS